MRILDYFKLAKVNLKRNTKLFLRNVVLIAISITSLLISHITTSSMNNTLNRYISDNMTFRTLYVNKKDYSEISIADIENINHVIKVVRQEDYKTNKDITRINNKENEGAVDLLGCNPKTSPPIISGRTLYENEDDACIVPKKFYIGSIREIIDSDKIMDGGILLGKEIEIAYYTYKYTEEEHLMKEEHIKKLKVVGIYDTEDTMGDYNECYVDYNVIKEINNINSNDINDNISPVLAIIDSFNNVDEVIQDLSNLNYEAFLYSTPNYTIVNIIGWVGKIIAISIMVLVIVNIIINSAKNSKDRRKEYALLKAIGYNKSNIWKIIIVESIIWGIVSFLIACIITFIILGILLKIQSNLTLDLQKIKISVDFAAFIVCFGISIVIPSIGNILSSIRIINKPVIYNSKE